MSRRGLLTEWVAAGPLGLEQGFTVQRRPPGEGRTLQVSLAVGGDVSPERVGSDLSFVSKGGLTSLRYGGLSAIDATGRPLRGVIALAGDSVVLRVRDRGAIYPVRIDPFIQQGSKLTASDELGQAIFGIDVALSADGNTALIGGSGDASGTGAAWVFVRTGTTWTEQAKLTGTGETSNGLFGEAVALSADGNTAVVSAATDGMNAGAIWVFTRSGSAWIQQGPKLTPPDEVGAAAFGGFPGGVALSADGNTALIGGSQDNNVGAAWVYTRSGSTWTEQQKLTANNDEIGSGNFGAAVSLSGDGNTALIGGYGDNNFKGAAWIFTRSGTSWTQQGQKLTGSDEVGQGSFGLPVKLSADGSTALIGGNQDNGSIGAAWVFTLVGSAWTQQGPKLTANDETGNGEFGSGVALSADGNVALIGGFSANTVNGAAWAFSRFGSTWTQQGTKILPADAAGVANFGDAAALSADAGTGLIGGPADNGGIGAAWVFTQPPTCTNTTAATPAGGGAATISFACAAPGDGGPLTYQIVSGPAHGSLASATGASIGYTSASGFNGTDQVTYQARDSLGTSNVATATITVPPAPPVCVNVGAQTAPGGGSAQMTLRCSAPAGVRLTYAVVSPPSHGRVSAISQASGTLVYVSRLGYSGIDSFTYQATDPGGASNTATARIRVRKPLGTLAFAVLYAQSDAHAAYTRVISMYTSDLPIGTRIRIACLNRICSLKTRTVTVTAQTRCKAKTKRCRGKHRPNARAVDLSALVRNRHLKVGSRFEVTFQKRNYVGKVYLITIRASKLPVTSAKCLAPGSSVPGRGCSAG